MSAAAALPMRPMGKQGLQVSMQCYGCMGLTAFYGAALEEEQALAVLQKALELGVTHFDTAEAYSGKDAAGNDKHNEELLGKFIAKVGREKVTFATKYFPGSPERQKCSKEVVVEAFEGSLKRLGTDSVDLYYLHRIPGEEGLKSWMEACKELVAEGKIKYLGLSEATPEEIRMAHAIHPLTAIQQEWSLITRNLEKDIVPVCRELGIGIVAYSPLCRGLTSCMVKTQDDWSKIGNEGGAATGFQTTCPNLVGDNLTANVALLEPLEQLAAELKVTPSQLSLAWVQAQGEDVFPIPGTTKIANLESNVGAAKLSEVLTKEMIEKIGPDPSKVQGHRYPDSIHGLSYENKAQS
jgi:aryl-alcohol dehydrogenase-like predicted oxidoreductase